MENIKRLHPGVYIKESLEAMEMTSREFSQRTGISERTLSAIINGNGDITFDVAYKLSVYFDNSINYWTNLQNQYNLYLMKQEQEIEFEKEWSLVKTMKKYLLEVGYILAGDSREEIVNKCRNITGVNSLSLLNIKDSFVSLKEQHVEKDADCFSQNFWLASALNEARKEKTSQYNKEALVKSLDEIRNMTTQSPEVFFPRLKEIFSECGISFVLLPYLSKSNIYGATKWFSKDNVMLAISNRGGKVDMFWFTLFHEIAHVLMEHRREVLFNIKGIEDIEADELAKNLLIPEKEWEKFVKRKTFDATSIAFFAKRVNVDPSIVLGRLHKEKPKEVPYGMYDGIFNNSYKVVHN